MADRIGRRELLVAGGTVGIGGVATYLWTVSEPGRGRVAARELTAGDETLIYEDDNEEQLAGVFVELGYDSVSEVLVSEHLSRLQEAYGALEYGLVIDSDRMDRDRFTTNIGVFDTVDVGDYVAFQVSIADSGSIRNLSCVASEREALETHCEFQEVDVTE